MKKTKILHIITRFIKGGADQNTLLTVLGLDKKKYDVYLAFGSGYDKKQVELVRKNKIKTRYFLLLKHFNIFALCVSLIQIYNYIKKNNFDIVHTHSTEAGIVGRVAARLAGTKMVIHTVHGIPFTPYRSKFLNSFVCMLEKYCAGFTTKIIANANLIRDDYLKRRIGKRNQYVTIYSGIDIKEFRKKIDVTKIKKTLGIKNEHIVTNISRLANGKGHEYLLKAAKTILKKIPNTKFLIIGDGELRRKIKEEIKELRLERKVLMLGQRDDIAELIAISDFIVLPSLWEGTPRIIPEAMAMKKPVIATRIAGIPEQIIDGKTGVLVRPKDVQGLAKAMLYLLKNKKKAERMGVEATKIVNKFSAAKMVADIDKLYTSLKTQKL